MREGRSGTNGAVEGQKLGGRRLRHLFGLRAGAESGIDVLDVLLGVKRRILGWMVKDEQNREAPDRHPE